MEVHHDEMIKNLRVKDRMADPTEKPGIRHGHTPSELQQAILLHRSKTEFTLDALTCV